ncbi:hypothetical protein [Streptomyces sp. CB02400]|uniref:hypothetical protein n=1 Tax=unclassified Streptomyces TaxID=2593676 RepID=UPI0019138E0E|nr:hypothetical protein [Streptomyces sp. CB02400]
MGVLTDCFRAPDAAAVVQSLEETDGGSPLFAEPPLLDGVDAKGVDPAVVLGRPIAVILRTEWRVDLVEQTTVRPPSPRSQGRATASPARPPFPCATP